MLLGPDCRLVTILGIGGIGKTRLTLALAHRLRAEFAHVAMVSLRATARADEILSAIGRALGITPGRGDDAVLELLRSDNPHLLLVLDNFEHLLPEGVEVLDLLLNEVPRLRCVVTSRQALSTRWEWRYQLAELSFPAESAEDSLAGYSSVQLFLQIARRVRSRQIEGAELRQVMRICRLVGGMPLGVELAAAQVGSLSCAAIADQIAAGVERLTTDLRDLPIRQRSLAASFDVSWAALSPQEENVLARLSVIYGGFKLEAALMIAEAAVADITRLVDKSLVRSSGTDWYSLHEVIKQHAAGKLEMTPGAREAVFARYRDYLTMWGERNLARYVTPLTWEQEAADQLENHVHHLWYVWLNSRDQPQSSQIAVALVRAEGTYRGYTGNSAENRAGKMSTWKGLEIFTRYDMQAVPVHSGVLVIDSVWLPSIADRLADLTEEFATHAESFLPEVVDACRVDGRLLALPNDVNLGLLYYRHDLLRKYGYSLPPATWEELEQMATVIQAGERAAGHRDFWGFIWPGHKPESLTCTALEWQHSEGGGCIIERDGRISIANEHTAAALAGALRDGWGQSLPGLR